MLPWRRTASAGVPAVFSRAWVSARWMLRTVRARLRRMLAVVVAVLTAAAQFMVPVTVTAGVAAAATATVVAKAAPARAATGSVLILSTSVNGGSTSAEAQAVPTGYTVTVALPSTWDAMTTSQFAAYSAIIIGDPSTTSCATSVPTDALNTAATWGAAVTGNVAVLGTAPAYAGSQGTTLLSDAIAYAVAGSGTGLYVSLNCEYATAAAGTDVPLLASVEGGGFALTGQGASCPNSGTVNTWERVSVPAFNSLPGGALASWGAPGCSVAETLNAWPSQFNVLGYDTAATPAAFTASDGGTGQAYVVAGASVSAATQALSPSTGGEVPAGATTGGSNPAAPGVSASTVSAADPVNPENGDFTESATDFSVPTFGPSLDFTRSYDAQVAQQQTQTGTPGPLGYGWTDNWATSLSQASPMPADIYLLDGRRTDNGDGGPPLSAVLDSPGTVYYHGGDVYIADTAGNRVQEIPGTSGTQWGLSMTAGDEYTVVGNGAGGVGMGADGASAGGGRLNSPGGMTIDASGNMYIADTGNCRVVEIPAASGTQWGISMTADDYYTIAGRGGSSNCTVGNDNKVATQSNLNSPNQVATDAAGDVYIADTANNRVQEVAATTKTQWGQSMTATFVYTVAGSSAGTSGFSGTGGAATSALLNGPEGVAVSAAGNMYIADTTNCRVAEVPPVSGTQWGQLMTANDIYTVAGRGGSTNCTVGNDAKVATSSNLNYPAQVETGAGTSEDLYIADTANNRIQEVARANATEWGQAMTATFVYTVAGSAAGTGGFSGNGGAATSATMNAPQSVSVSSTTLYTADTGNNRVRQVNTSGTINGYAGNGYTLATTGNGGPAIEAGLSTPEGEVFDPNGDVFIADSANNRIQEIAVTTHTQYGISMTAGDVYTIAGSAKGASGKSGNGGAATSALLNSPESIAEDSSGNLYIADTNNCRIQKVTTGGTMSTVAGSSAGTCGISGDGVAATSALLNGPEGVILDAKNDIYIADTLNNRVQEVFASGGQTFGHTMTAGDIYTIVGSATGTSGHSGDGGAATSALLSLPVNMGTDHTGNLYIADWGNNRIQEVPVKTATMRGQAMTKYDIYTVAGNASGTAGIAGDGGKATSSYLNAPGNATVDLAGNIYITDGNNNRVQEVAAANGTQWSTAMTANDIYTVAGSATGSSGNSGDGGPASAALMHTAENISLDPAGDMYITDYHNNHLREVTSATAPTITPAPGYTSALYPAPGGITITQPEGAQITFYAQTNGTCTAPYVTAGQYCTLPQNTATLSYNSSTSTYTFTPSPGTTYTYGWNGVSAPLTKITDAAGNVLGVGYGTPAPSTASCPPTAASCNTITAANGRSLVIGLNSSGLVTSVTDPLGRQWTYAYTSSDLTSATDPMGHVTTYTYGQGSTGNPQLADDLLTITKPNGQTGGSNAGKSTVNVYDASGRVTSQTDPMGFQTTFDYSSLDPSTGTGVVRVNDPDGNTTVYGYTQGAQTAQSVWTGTALTSEDDYVPDLKAGGTSGGTLLDTSIADGDAKITSYTYDSAKNTTSTTDPLGNQTTQWSTSLNQDSCDGAAEASSACSSGQTGPAPVAPGGVITPPSSAPPAGVTYSQYDSLGNTLWTDTGVYQPGASSASYQQVNYTLYKGNSVTLNNTAITCNATPSSPSLPCAKINPDGVVTQLAYNSYGDLTLSSTPDGNGTELATTTNTYNADGEQTATTSPDGNLPDANAGNYTTTTAYNNDGQQTSVTQAGGAGATVTPRTTSYGYDANSNQISVTDPRNYTTTNTYNADDQQTLVTDPDGNATLTCYDGDGNATETVPPVGVAANNLTLASCPTSYPSGYGNRLAADATSYTYDDNGHQTQVTTPAPAGQTGVETTTYTYDGAGNLTRATAPPTTDGGPNQVTVDSYDASGQLVSETTGYGTSAASTISYCHDPNGNQTSVVYPDGNTSGVAVCETASPWVVSASVYPAQASYQTTSSYDSTGELVSATSPATAVAPSGATTTSTYDPTGNTLTRGDPNGVTTTWTYTPLNMTASASYTGSSAHSVTYAYDANGNKTGMTDATGTSSYIYDPFGELTSTTNGPGQAIGYGHNPDGSTTSITYPLPPSATWATTSTANYGYDHADLLTSVTDFNGNTTTIGNTADAQPQSAALATTGDSITTAYDNSGTPSAIALKNGATTLQSFTYTDAPARNILNEADTPSSSQSPVVYTYDAKSRVTSMTPGTGSTVNYTFDPTGNLTTTPTGAAATYDKVGELTASSLSGATTSYTYNADGQRLAATQGSTTIASGTWNGAGQLTAYNNNTANMSSATYDGNGMRTSTTITPSGGTAATQNYLWNGHNLLMDATNAYIYTSGSAPAEQVNLATGAITYLIADSLGSVRCTVNSSGALTGTTSYDAWGNPQTRGLTASTPFGYSGGYTDPGGLIYLINRYYDPATGQFTSIDPEVRQTHQPYAYVAGNPVSNSDPTGLAVNMSGVVSWALNHAWCCYGYFQNDDCTDFASRALAYGGGDPMSYHWNATVDDRYWWYVSSYNYSHSWSIAQDLANHLVYKGSPRIYHMRYARPGDIIFANFHGSSYWGITHTGVITAMWNGIPRITQHSYSRENESIYKWLDYSSEVHVWIYYPHTG